MISVSDPQEFSVNPNHQPPETLKLKAYSRISRKERDSFVIKYYDVLTICLGMF